MQNLRRRVLKNLDLAVDSAIFEGELVLKKYDSLHFYLRNIAFGHINTFQALQTVDKVQVAEGERPRFESKADRRKSRRAMTDLRRAGTIAPFAESLSSTQIGDALKLNMG